MADFITSQAFTITFCIVVISAFTGFCGFILGKSWAPEQGDGGGVWDVPDYPPDDLKVTIVDMEASR